MPDRTKMYTTKTAAAVLGLKQDTVKHYAAKFKLGSQPGGKGTPWLFTVDDLQAIRDARSRKWFDVERAEDREELELGPLYNPDASPRP